MARHLRRNQTWAERLMWKWLRDRRFSRFKFRRQHPMGPYVLDFFCEGAMLNIELDGDQHDDPVNRKRDQRRDAWLASRGIEVLRFWNGRLRREKEVVRQVLWETLQERASDPLREEDD